MGELVAVNESKTSCTGAVSPNATGIVTGACNLNVRGCNDPILTKSDCKAYTNIQPIPSLCKHNKLLGFGQALPCQPLITAEWNNTVNEIGDSSEPILIRGSNIDCLRGGLIEIVDPNQYQVFTTPELEKEIAEIEAVLEELEPGTPVYDALLQELADLKNQNTDFDNLPLGKNMRTYFDYNISALREGQLFQMRDNLVNKYLQNGELSHADIGNILDDMRDIDTLSDIEKAYVWSVLAENKEGGSWILGKGGEEGEYIINNDGVNPDVIDSAIFNADATQIHTVVEFTDNYHGRMGGKAGDNGAAEAEIENTEKGRGFPRWWRIPRLSPNEGDANASLAMVDAFRGFREGGYDEFADRWQDNMLAPPEEEEFAEVPAGTTTIVPVPEPTRPTTTTTKSDTPTGTTTTTVPDTPSGTTTTTR